MKKSLSLILAALLCAAMTVTSFAEEAVIEEIAADDAGIMLISEEEGQIVEEVVLDAETVNAIAALCGVEVTPEFVEALLALLVPAEEVVEEVVEEATEEVVEEAAEEVVEEAAEEVVEEVDEIYALAEALGVVINEEFVAAIRELVPVVEEAVVEEVVVEEVVVEEAVAEEAVAEEVAEEAVVEEVVEEAVVEEAVKLAPADDPFLAPAKDDAKVVSEGEVINVEHNKAFLVSAV